MTTAGVHAERPTVDASAPEPPRPRLLAKLALLALSLLLVGVVLEVAFRLLGFQPLYEVYSKPEAFWQYDPLLGWSLEPGATGEFVGPRPFPVAFRAPVRVNALGFRDQEVTDVPAGGHRVLLLGDSQAAGFEVPLEHTYASVIEQELGVDVVNAAVRGYGTDQALLSYRERGRDLDADVVVYHATANDPEDNTTLHRSRRQFGKPAFAFQQDGSLQLLGSPVPDYPLCSAYRLVDGTTVARVDTLRNRLFCVAQTRLADHSALFSFVTARVRQHPGLVRLLYGLGTPEGQAGQQAAATAQLAFAGAVPAAAPPALDAQYQLTSVLIGALADEVERDGARFVLLGEDADLRQLDVSGFEQDGITIVRTNEALGPDQSLMRFANDGHLNQEGHRRVGELLAPRLAELLAP